MEPSRWDQWAPEYEKPGRHNWARDEPCGGAAIGGVLVITLLAIWFWLSYLASPEKNSVPEVRGSKPRLLLLSPKRQLGDDDSTTPGSPNCRAPWRVQAKYPRWSSVSCSSKLHAGSSPVRSSVST